MAEQNVSWTLSSLQGVIVLDGIMDKDVPWNVPEAHIQLTSAGVFGLDKSLTDVFGFRYKGPG